MASNVTEWIRSDSSLGAGGARRLLIACAIATSAGACAGTPHRTASLPPPAATVRPEAAKTPSRSTEVPSFVVLASGGVPVKPDEWRVESLECRSLDGHGIEPMFGESDQPRQPDRLCRATVVGPDGQDDNQRAMTLRIARSDEPRGKEGPHGPLLQVRRIHKLSRGRRLLIFVLPDDSPLPDGTKHLLDEGGAVERRSDAC